MVKLEYQNLKLERFNQIVKKVINFKAQTALCPCFGIQKIDQHYFWDNRPANYPIAKLQGSSMNDFQTEKPKAQSQELFFAYHYLNNKHLNKKRPKKAC